MSSQHSLSYYLREGVQGIFKHGFSSLSAIWAITACLIIGGTGLLLALILTNAVTDLGRNGDICAYIDDSLSEEEVVTLSDAFSCIPNVASIDYVDRDENLANLRERLGDNSSVLDGLETDNPLRSYYRIWVVNLEDYSQTVDNVRATVGVTEVYAPVETIQFLMQVHSVLIFISGAFLILFGLLSISQISNTLKLIANDRREEITIIKMIGATNSFIRAPLIVESFILSFVSACLSFAVQWLICHFLLSSVLSSLGLLSVTDISQYLPFFASGDLLLALILGIVGSIRPIHKYLCV